VEPKLGLRDVDELNDGLWDRNASNGTRCEKLVSSADDGVLKLGRDDGGEVRG